MRRTAPVFGLVVLAAALSGCGTIRLDRPLTPPRPSEAPPPPLVQAWEADVDAAFGPSAPVVGGGLVAVGTRKGDVVVLDARTGRRAGRVGFGSSVEGGLVASPDGMTLYVPVARGRYGVVAHGVRDGQRRWAWRPDSAMQAVDAGLVLAGNTLVAALHDGAVIGLDAATGAERWRQPGAVGAQNHAAPVLLVDGLVSVADDRGLVRGLDAATGAVRWAVDVGAPVYAAPLLADGTLVVPTTRGTLVALHAWTGTTLWAADLDPTGRARLTTPAVSLVDHTLRVVVGLTDGRVVALDAESGAVLWTWAGTGAVLGAPAASGPTVYVGTADRRLVALDARTGAETWSTALRGRVKSALTVADGRLLVLTEPRHVVSFQTAPAAASAPVAARP